MYRNDVRGKKTKINEINEREILETDVGKERERVLVGVVQPTAGYKYKESHIWVLEIDAKKINKTAGRAGAPESYF